MYINFQQNRINRSVISKYQISKIVPNHPLHLLQKKALRIFASKDYMSHTEPICKEYRILKIFDMYKLAI